MSKCETCIYSFRGTPALNTPLCKECYPTGKYPSFEASPVDTLGVKYDSEKLRWTLLPFQPLQEVVEVLEYGAKKYAPDNWMYVNNPEERYFNAAMRHMVSWQIDDVEDSETGKSHLAHAICCLLYLLWFEQKERP